jgi:hypothetical protein
LTACTTTKGSFERDFKDYKSKLKKIETLKNHIKTMDKHKTNKKLIDDVEKIWKDLINV